MVPKNSISPKNWAMTQYHQPNTNNLSPINPYYSIFHSIIRDDYLLRTESRVLNHLGYLQQLSVNPPRYIELYIHFQ